MCGLSVWAYAQVGVRVFVMLYHINLNVYKSRRIVMPQGQRLGSSREAHSRGYMIESLNKCINTVQILKN